MTFCIITHVPHGIKDHHYFAYAPYVREMNIWLKYTDKVIIVAPLENIESTAIHLDYHHNPIVFSVIPKMDLLSTKALFLALIKSPKVCWTIYKAMRKADHIHLRCPGNIGLLGCIVQILFPGKPKTAKYAGNWDPNASQPWSYKLQRWILSNTFLTKNMQALVYGEWEGNSKNIKPFFTATYREADKIDMSPRPLNGKIKFLFVGTLTEGKRPLYAIRLVEKLAQSGFDVSLRFFGEGKEREPLQEYCNANQFSDLIEFEGNQTEAIVRKAYQESHFIILPSQSEGWPKVVAESMFWGCLPIATKVSCVANMLDSGGRGILLDMDFEKDVESIISILKNQSIYDSKVRESMIWSRKYTLDLFENEIKGLLNS
jgi:glycosyltransferase involved in cell wall biosynthesis